MKTKFTKKRILTVIISMVVPVLLIQAYVMADPSAPPPGGNVTANFSSANFVDDVTIAVPEGNDAQFFVGNDAGTWGRMMLDAGSDDLFFETAVNDIPNDNQLVLSSGNGNVGIGNATPSNELSIGDGIGLAIGTSAVATDDDRNTAFGVGEAINTFGTMQWDFTNDLLRLYALTDGGLGNTVSQLVLEGGTGNVGVGTSIPFANFQIGNTTLGDTDFTTNHPKTLAIVDDSGTSDPAIWLGEDNTNKMEIVYDVSESALDIGMESTNTFNEYLSINGNGVGILGGDPFTALTVGTFDNIDQTFKTNHPMGLAIGNDSATAEPALWMGRNANEHAEIIYDNDANSLDFRIQTQQGLKSVLKMTASSTANGRVGIGMDPDSEIPLSVTDSSQDFVAQFLNNGNTTTSNGLLVKAGSATSGTLLSFLNGANGNVGTITHSLGTTSYNPFTGSHHSTIPETDNQDGYEYGTIMSIKDVNTENGSHQAEYFMEPSLNSYESTIAGVYSMKYADKDNLHQIYAVGDGHALVTTENGSIKAGDPITSSNLEGKGMKATNPGTILGYALEDWDGSSVTRTETLSDGTEVKVGLVAVYYYPGTYFSGNNQELTNKIAQQDQTIQDLQNQINELKGILEELTN